MKYSFEDYVEIIKKLRAPDGCPWDRAQTHESLKPCMINETVEALAAIDVWRETGDDSNLCEELGDMLLQVVLQSQIAAEEGLFDISDVLQAACEKMIRRHPHVFTENKELPDWDAIKRAEKAHIPPEVEEAKRRALERAQKDMIRHLENVTAHSN
ncbi:MazG nucleotide pyrophosphohydrolase domain-containing protein [Marvinbryantia formatexigens]|nr:MazG nucleotide pyrophosphohydrolase domain-containing protein [Marvinbryantia formatexigens]UWO25554.1 nucleotide pyrophosphohydrolase [Marvinbryantia formatexigens DSM 14469]SDG20128.1 tetrapyrrole methylase family protein / MazG family protein [Marvinbryantia formatexigens]